MHSTTHIALNIDPSDIKSCGPLNVSKSRRGGIRGGRRGGRRGGGGPGRPALSNHEQTESRATTNKSASGEHEPLGSTASAEATEIKGDVSSPQGQEGIIARPRRIRNENYKNRDDKYVRLRVLSASHSLTMTLHSLLNNYGGAKKMSADRKREAKPS